MSHNNTFATSTIVKGRNRSTHLFWRYLEKIPKKLGEAWFVFIPSLIVDQGLFYLGLLVVLFNNPNN